MLGKIVGFIILGLLVWLGISLLFGLVKAILPLLGLACLGGLAYYVWRRLIR